MVQSGFVNQFNRFIHEWFNHESDSTNWLPSVESVYEGIETFIRLLEFTHWSISIIDQWIYPDFFITLIMLTSNNCLLFLMKNIN